MYQAAIQTLVAMFILRETSDPSVLRKSAKSESSGSNRWGAFVTAFARPVKLATLSPVVILSALKMSMAYVIFYILMSDLPILFGDKYDFDSSQIGYCYISPTIGAVFGFTILGGLADRVFHKRTVKRGMSKPQDRLAIMSFEVLLIAIGILAYGWSAQAHMHWIIPLLGANLTMVGSSGVVVSMQQYLTDYFGPHVPGAIAVCTVLRSVLGSVLPSTIPALFGRLGYGWGSSVLAAAVLLFCPITSLLNRFEGYYENAQMY